MGFYNSIAPVTRDGMQQQDQCDFTGSPYANNEGRKPTYKAVTSGVVVTANGAFFTLQGSATKVIRVTRVYAIGVLTTAAQVLLQVNRTTADVTSSAGAVTITPRLLTSGSAAATAVAKSYTSSTLGTGNVLLASNRSLYAPATAVATGSEFLFGGRNSQALVLNGAAEWMQVTCAASSYTGALFDIDVEFTEEPIAGA